VIDIETKGNLKDIPAKYHLQEGGSMKSKSEIVPNALIENRIFVIRGHKVMLDFHLAELYGVPTKSLNLAVKRNLKRFPDDFMFQLTGKEFGHLKEILRFQFETSKSKRRGGRRYMPYAFSEHGVAMLATVLHSEQAIQVNIAIIRAFVKLREILSTHKELAFKLKQLETKVEKHDEEIQAIFEAIRQLIAPPEKPKRPIGF
jgi:phage regulator Rha-like protein